MPSHVVFPKNQSSRTAPKGGAALSLIRKSRILPGIAVPGAFFARRCQNRPACSRLPGRRAPGVVSGRPDVAGPAETSKTSVTVLLFNDAINL
ncbi:hypothetical protein PATSB16_06320 [Pandoraea thiooxydans]|nr:hypothetical protein PATSB16_06320 [Pandoraea thiooxydans]